MGNYTYVNTKMGTQNQPRYSNGNCYPITAVPHGMASFTFTTDSTKNELSTTNWFYSPYHKTFEGITLTHIPSPWLGDYGKITVCGQRGEFIHHRGIYYAYYDTNLSVIEPAYMKARVTRDRYDIELAPTNTGAVIRIKFDKEEENGPYRLVFLGEAFKLRYDENTGLIIGETTQCDTRRYYRVSTENQLREYIVIEPSVKVTIDEAEDVYAITANETEFECRIATSFLSAEQAILNFNREVKGKSFEEIRNSATEVWENYLSKINIEDPDEDKKATFYSCMYRAFLWPRRFYENDKDGKPYHLNFETGKAVPGYLYVDNGFWDTYRTLYPYLSLMDRDIYAEIAEGCYNYYLDNGWLPKWLCPHNVNCMPGMLVEATLSDAIVKEIVTGELAENIFRAMLQDGECAAKAAGDGRVCLNEYRKYGYIPYTAAVESVNETLDNTFGDYCIAKAAEKLGHKDIAERYFGYAKNYKNLFDKETGFMRPKDEFGVYREADKPFNPCLWGRDYTEAAAWQSSFAVYHDINGLNELYEGKLADKIDELMATPARYDIAVPGYGRAIHEMAEMYEANYGQCAINNQPAFHIPFIYSELGIPEKTSYHVENLAKLFSATPEGYPGDEDNGTTSAWYLLAALGLYQIAPSKPEFTASLPLFEKMTVKLSGGNTLTINKADYDLSKMNGMVSYEKVMAGGALADLVKNK